jgi:hypothetical protein
VFLEAATGDARSRNVRDREPGPHHEVGPGPGGCPRERGNQRTRRR